MEIIECSNCSYLFVEAIICPRCKALAGGVVYAIKDKRKCGPCRKRDANHILLFPTDKPLNNTECNP